MEKKGENLNKQINIQELQEKCRNWRKVKKTGEWIYAEEDLT